MRKASSKVSAASTFSWVAVVCRPADGWLSLWLWPPVVVGAEGPGADPDGARVSFDPVSVPLQSIRPSDTRSLPALTK